MSQVVTYTQEEIVDLVAADVRQRFAVTSLRLDVVRREAGGESRFEVQVELDAPPPGL